MWLGVMGGGRRLVGGKGREEVDVGLSRVMGEKGGATAAFSCPTSQP